MIWIGTKESDISDTNNFFTYSITTNGSNTGNNISFSVKDNTRINYNKSNRNYINFLIEELTKVISENPNIQIMYYNPVYAYNLAPAIRQHVCCLNSMELMNLLGSKSDMRLLASNITSIVPFEMVEGKSLQTILQEPRYANGAILQETVSSGGEGTFIIQNITDLQYISFEGNYLISPYYEYNIPININFIVFDNEIIMFPPSIQIIEEMNGKLLFMGTDYHTEKYNSYFKNSTIYETTLKLAKKLQNMGYRGIGGFDYIYVQHQLLFLECNPRFQASTFLLNLSLKEQNLPSVQELNYMAFHHLDAPVFDFTRLKIPYSCISYIYQDYIKNTSINHELYNDPNIYDILLDGFNNNMKISNAAYLYRVIFSKSITSITPEHHIITYNNLLPANKKWFNMILSKDILALKIALLNQGIHIPQHTLNYILSIGGMKTSVFDSIDIVLSNGMTINCPYKINYAELSPFTLKFKDGNLELQYYNNTLDIIQLESFDSAREYKTITNCVPFRRLSYLGGDRLRIHHTDICHFKQFNRPCEFCNLPTNGFKFELSDIYEIIDYYLQSRNFRHILIGGGSNKLENEFYMIMEVVKYIRSKTDIPIYVMCLPITDEEKLKALYDVGVNEIGFNIEVWNPSNAKMMMPGKGNISRDVYLNALISAKKIWKNDYAVRTLLIVGLEHKEIIKEAIENLCINGIMPILSVFRPLPNSKMVDCIPPRNEYLYALYKELSNICKKYNQKLGPNCIPCQNNTLSLPW